MKHLSITLFILTSVLASSQTYYDLNWKIKNKKHLAYTTVMEVVDSAELKLPKVFEEFSKLINDSIKIKESDYTNFFKHFYENINDYTTISILQRQGNWINVSMIRENLDKEKKSENDNKFTQMLQGIQLRGILNPNGNIESFYTKNAQKNLLAVLFQLPSKPVKIGDKWPIDINWITTDHHFVCDSMSRINEVELIDVKITKKDTIAILKYKNYERVSGTFKIPFGNKNIPSVFDIKYDALCEFSINEGKWINYSGIFSYLSIGYQDVETKQRFVLIEKKKIPKEIKAYLD